MKVGHHTGWSVTNLARDIATSEADSFSRCFGHLRAKAGA
jgi:hypothetical protein